MATYALRTSIKSLIKSWDSSRLDDVDAGVFLESSSVRFRFVDGVFEDFTKSRCDGGLKAPLTEAIATSTVPCNISFRCWDSRLGLSRVARKQFRRLLRESDTER